MKRLVDICLAMLALLLLSPVLLAAIAKYYEGIRNTAGAIFVKLCDRLANVKYSKDTNSRMLEVYKSEYSEFINALFPHNLSNDTEKVLYFPLLKDLEEIINS